MTPPDAVVLSGVAADGLGGVVSWDELSLLLVCRTRGGGGGVESGVGSST